MSELSNEVGPLNELTDVNIVEHLHAVMLVCISQGWIYLCELIDILREGRIVSHNHLRENGCDHLPECFLNFRVIG